MSLESNRHPYNSPYAKLCYLRSILEVRIARILDRLCEAGVYRTWSYEAEQFRFKGSKGGSRIYIPDFRVVDRAHKVFYIEGKGVLKPNDIKKMESIKLRGYDIYLLMSKDVAQWEKSLLLSRI